MTKLLKSLLTAGALLTFAQISFAQSVTSAACTNRGDLDNLYCDANKDLVADVPTDKSKWKNPVSYTHLTLPTILRV